MLSRTSAAKIGLVYLEDAILDALEKNHYRPENLARILSLYPGVRVGDRPAGNLIVRAILEGLERDGRVQRSDKHPQDSWELTENERYQRL